MTTLNPIVIIGTGLAGYNLAKELRKIDTLCPLVLITQDDGHFYSKPMLSTALSQGKTPQSLIITPLETIQQQLNATIYTFSKVTDVDIAQKQITLETPKGTITLAYQQCVLAMGASPRNLPILDNIPHYKINNLQDYAAFMAEFSQTRELTIIGSGLVGCEFAHDFSHLDPSIHVITPDAYPLAQLVPEPVGKAIQEALAQKGVQWHTQEYPKHPLPSKTILSAVGLLPNVTLAKNAGISVNHGIVVDEYLNCAPSVYALGDCAEINGICHQFVAPLLHCARALAQTLCGKLTPVNLPPSPIALKLPSFAVNIFPPPKINGEWEITGVERDIKALFYDEQSQLRGYALAGAHTSLRQECFGKLVHSPS